MVGKMPPFLVCKLIFTKKMLTFKFKFIIL